MTNLAQFDYHGHFRSHCSVDLPIFAVVEYFEKTQRQLILRVEHWQSRPSDKFLNLDVDQQHGLGRVFSHLGNQRSFENFSFLLAKLSHDCSLSRHCRQQKCVTVSELIKIVDERAVLSNQKQVQEHRGGVK